MADQLMHPGLAHFLVGHAHGLALSHGEIEAAADGKLRNHDMER